MGGIPERAERGPVDRVPHVFAQRLAPVSLCAHMLGEDNGQRRDALQREAPLVGLRRICLVKGLRGALGWWGLVGSDLFVVAPSRLRGALHHDVATDLVKIVAQTVRELRAGRVEQQARGLDGVSRHRHQPGSLAILASLVKVDDPGRPALTVDLDAADHAVRTDLSAMSQRVRNVCDQGRCLGVDLAPLQAEASVDAV